MAFTEAYRAAAPASTELWEPAGSPHVGGLATHPEEYRTRVLAFLDAALAEA
jgi:hypothetical protein